MKKLASNRNLGILGGLTFFSFLLRFSLTSKEVVYPDSCLYLSFAKSILKGKFSFDFKEGIKTIYPPLYSIADAVLSFFSGDLESSAVFVSVLAGTLLIIPVFYLARTLYQEKAAWFSAILVSLSPILLHWSGAMLTESLFITLFISGIALGLYAIEHKKGVLFFLSGAFIGLSYLARIIGLAAIPVIVLWTIFFFIGVDKSGSYSLKEICKKVGAFLVLFTLGFFIVTGPYLVHLRTVFGYWTVSASYGSVKGMVEAEGASTLSGWEGAKTQKAEETLAAKLVRKIMLNVRNYAMALLGMLFVTALFVIAGLFPRWKVLYVLSFILVYFGALLVQPLSPMLDERVRYLSPILPLLLVMASGGMLRIQEWLKGAAVKKAAIPVMIGIVLLSFLPQTRMFPVQFNKFWGKGNSVNLREKVGIWMKENLPAPVRVMSRKPYIPYYADAIWFVTPATYEEVIKLAHSKGVDYIVVDRSIEFYLRPELRFLFDTAQRPADLKFMGGIRHPRTQELYIGVYKIK